MRTLALIVLIFLCLTTVAAKEVASDTSTIPYYMYNAANKFKLDLSLLYAICRVESNCRPKAVNHDDGTKSEKQAGITKKSYGLFQVQLATAKSLGFQTKETIMVEIKRKGRSRRVLKVIDRRDDLLKPDVNVWYAAKLIRRLYDKYGDTVKVISAYNAGRPVSYNKEYVNKVLRQYARYKIDKNY